MIPHFANSVRFVRRRFAFVSLQKRCLAQSAIHFHNADVDLNRDYHTDRLDKFILKRYGHYTSVDEVPRLVSHEEMEGAKKKAMVEALVYVTVIFTVLLSGTVHIVRGKKVKKEKGDEVISLSHEMSYEEECTASVYLQLMDF